MVDMEFAKQQPKDDRARTPIHPAFGLATAIQKAGLIHEAEETAAVPFLVAVKHLGYSGPTGPALRALAALKSYGIMVEEAGYYRFTAEGLAALTHGEGEREALAKMAQKPEIFRQILARYADRLPSDPALKVTLVRDYHLSDATADMVIAALRETLDLVKPRADLEPGAAREASPVLGGELSDAASPVPPATSSERPAAPALLTDARTGVLHVWSLGKGVRVELRSNRPLSSSHFGLLKKYVEVAELAEMQADGEGAPPRE